MLKKMFSVVAVLALSGIAYGQANKIDAFTPVNGENATADGMAILQYHSGVNETSVLIILTNFTPNTVYDVDLLSPSQGEAAACDVLKTDDRGRAHVKITVSGNFSDADIGIFLSDDCSFSQDELRAVGSQTP